MAVATGTKLGPYEIIESVGAGGMGEVYRARDPRLGREVALKILPPSFAEDIARVRRFEQEARAAAAVHHPNLLIDRWPRVSRDGQRIAFGSDRMGSEQIWITDLKSRHTQRIDLPGSDIGESNPEWSANGREIIVTRAYKDGKQALWSVALDGSRAQELVAAEGPTDVVGGGISPDGTTVLYTSPVNGIQQIFSFNLAGRRAQQLTFSPGDKVDAIWSPEGKWIAFFSNLSGPLQLWKMAADGTHQQQLTTGYERVRHAFFAPDGKWIYYQPSHRNIFRMRVNGGASQQVTHFPDASLFIEEPTIWPDGKYLLYTRSNGGASLWLLKLR